MADVNDIKAAVELMDVKDDAQWNKDGSPKVEVVRENLKDQTVKKEDVLAAIGDWRRPAQAGEGTGIAPAAQAEPAAEKPDEVTQPEDPTAKLMAEVEARRAKRDALGEEITAEQTKMYAAQRRIDQLTKLQDVEINWLEANEKQVSHAEIVKRIQRQTVERLAQTKDATAAVAGVLAQSGMAVFPSKLDQTLALRRKTPEQQANYAKYVHQNAANVSAARG